MGYKSSVCIGYLIEQILISTISRSSQKVPDNGWREMVVGGGDYCDCGWDKV